MGPEPSGLHHVTGLAGDPQANVEFYAGALGLRFLVHTVNFEDVLMAHLYYGDDAGSPGSVVTFFPTPTADPGRVGKPQVSAVGFAVPAGSLSYWADRLAAAGHPVEGPTERFDERVLSTTDPDGTRVELAAAAPVSEPRLEGPVPDRASIRGLAGVSVLSANPYATASVLETLGFGRVGQEGDRVRYRAASERTAVVDLLDREAAFGREGPGTIHHVALRVRDREELLEWHDYFRGREYDVSRIRDRHFFHSLYVREPGGVLIELATAGPGLEAATPAPELYLPPRFEDDRELVESQLPPLRSPRSIGERADETGGEPSP
ncbi:VOC family protein [Natrononativus amylolyticus]|uniref:VOC family protein n=1 Tax=Natrononativus amylolyticus TaxID=2963434 RepID=UPI0020CF7491|nr:VOC family protein [Natrononativus amylolyticus]